MRLDIYGKPLLPGHCQVHPSVRQKYPCDLCAGENIYHQIRRGQQNIDDYRLLHQMNAELLHSLKGLLSIWPLRDNEITLAAKAVVEKVESQS